MVTELNDKQLMLRIQNHDKAAFTALYNRYFKKVCSFVVSKYNNVLTFEDATDVTQIAFARIWFFSHTYKVTQYAFKTWFYTVVKNCAADQIRKKKRKPTVSLDTTPVNDTTIANEIANTFYDSLESNDPDPCKHYEQNELLLIICKELEKTNAKELFHLLDGSSYEEIADVLEEPIGTVKSRIFRSRAALKEKVEKIYNYQLI